MVVSQINRTVKQKFYIQEVQITLGKSTFSDVFLGVPIKKGIQFNTILFIYFKQNKHSTEYVMKTG